MLIIIIIIIVIKAIKIRRRRIIIIARPGRMIPVDHGRSARSMSNAKSAPRAAEGMISS